MADPTLKANLSFLGDSLTATVLPSNFSPTYSLYVLQQDGIQQTVAGRANQAAQGAYAAQLRNDEQDVILEDHEDRISFIEDDYISKSAVVNQVVQAGGGALIVGSVASQTTDKFQVGGAINISSVYKVNGTQVLTARQTGWTAATGTAFKGTFNADLAWTIGVLNILQIQQIADALTEARKRIKALDDVLRTHGLIN